MFEILMYLFEYVNGFNTLLSLNEVFLCECNT